jgi:hypothetical protein
MRDGQFLVDFVRQSLTKNLSILSIDIFHQVFLYIFNLSSIISKQYHSFGFQWILKIPVGNIISLRRRVVEEVLGF